MLPSNYQIHQEIKKQTNILGSPEAFFEWLCDQDASTQDYIHEALADPAFGLESHQLMPNEEWRIWFLRMGRGSGKTYAASCGVHALARDFFPGGSGIIVGATVKDVRDTMILGESGLVNTAPPNFVPTFSERTNTVHWPNGSSAIVRTADNPEDIRGPTVNWGWADELVKWRSEKSWDNFRRTVRNKHKNGTRIIVTTTPKRAKQWIKDIEARRLCVVSEGSTLDNPHLDADFLADAANEQGARAREEVHGQWVSGASELWTKLEIDQRRIAFSNKQALLEACERRYLSVDPSGGRGRDECGIILFGVLNGKAVVIDDLTSQAKGNINFYCNKIVEFASTYLKQSDSILLEMNGHQAVRTVLENKNHRLHITDVWVKAREDKFSRAEEAYGYTMAGKVQFYGEHPLLEQQLTEWERDMKDSPDRGDAFTQGVRHICSQEYNRISRPIFNLGSWF
jgi:phage terminase large subunit-like protein